MQEVQFSATGWPELCPVVFSIPGGWLLVMRRAQVLTDVEFLTCDLDRFIMSRVPVEMKSDSFGWLDGRVVAIDYGS